MDLRAAGLGFLGAAVVLALLVWVVGPSEVFAALGELTAPYAVAIVAAAAGWLVSWALALRTVLHVLEVRVSAWRAILLYLSAAFANNVTPFGQAGGEPFSALLISRATSSEYERALAAVASVDTINFFPSIALAFLGLGYYGAVLAVGDRVLLVFGIVTTLAVGVPTAGFLVWRNRDRVEAAVVRLVAPVARVAGRWLPRVSPPSASTIRERVAAFFHSLETVAGSRRDLAIALSFSLLGWLSMAATLWLSLAAVGPQVPVAAVMVVVPVGAVASVTPLPGGAGGVEFAIVLLLVPIAGVTAEAATAAALISRAATFWLSTFLGGAAAGWLQGHPTG